MWIIFITIISIVIVVLIQWQRKNRKNVAVKQLVADVLPRDIASIRMLIVTDLQAFWRQPLLEKHDFIVIVDRLLSVALDKTERLKMLTKLGPVYYVWHEADYNENIQLADAHLREATIKVLSDQWARFEGEMGQILQIEGIDGKGNMPVDYSFSEIIAHHKWLVQTKHDKIKLTNEYSLVLQPFCLTYRNQMGQMVEWTFERKHCAYSIEIVS